ncbi:MAG: ATP-dependent protease, partial [Terriglobia bacterium]
MTARLELSAAELRRVCDPASLGFRTTADLPELREVLGQPRAVAALAFGASITGQGFNLFALGQPGSGKTTLIREYLEHRAESQPPPPDLCYVYNFEDARQPLALHLPAGHALQFQQDVEAFIAELKTEIPKAFESEEYGQHRSNVLQAMEDQRREILTHIESQAAEAGLRLLK